MTIDLKSILTEHFIRMFEVQPGLIAMILAVAIVAFTFRHYIAFYLDLSKRQENKFTLITLLVSIGTLALTGVYLYMKQYIFLLSIQLSFILVYFLYMVGIIDMLVEKLEGRYGR